MDVTAKLAFVTGGARGVGFALAQECAARGAHVVLTDFDAARLDQAAAQRSAAGGSQIDFLNSCTPGYYNPEGWGLTRMTAQGFGDGLGPAAFFRLLEAWRPEGRFAGLEFTA